MRSWIGFGLSGPVGSVAGTLGGFGRMARLSRAESLILRKARQAALDRRASHYTVTLFGALGWIALVRASLLDGTATDRCLRLRRV